MIINILTSGYSSRDKFILIVAFAAAAMFAIIGHEYAHGWVAVKNGDLTPKLSGRLTLNPAAHFSLFGMLMFFFVGFGWAKPVPINPANFEHKKKGIFLTSIAGVTANFIMALIWLGMLCLLALVPDAAIYKSQIGYIFYVLFFYFFFYSIMLNMSLMLFNLLPVFPLDGFHVVEVLSKPGNKYVQLMYRYGMWSLLIVFMAVSFIPAKYNMFSLFLGAVQDLINIILISIG